MLQIFSEFQCLDLINADTLVYLNRGHASDFKTILGF